MKKKRASRGTGFQPVRASRQHRLKTRATEEHHSLSLNVVAATGKQSARYLRRHLLVAHKMLRPALRELSVALVNVPRMSLLHEQFLGIRGPTDVLTFPLETDGKGSVISGEVVVCVPVARREAKIRGIPVRREVLLYALHGMLHLCGFDDRTSSAYRKMHRMEDQILTQLGIGPTFAARRKAGRAP